MVQRGPSANAPLVASGREPRFGLGHSSCQSGYNKLFTQVSIPIFMKKHIYPEALEFSEFLLNEHL